MKLLFEEYHYSKNPFANCDIPLAKVLAEGEINAKHVDNDNMLSIDYVGYFFSKQLNDCVFILPKVLIDENNKLFDSYSPEYFLSIDTKNADAKQKEMLAFVYEFSLWVYRGIDVFRHRKPNSDIAVNPEITQMGHGRKRDRYTFVDIVLALLDFNRKNQDYLTFVIRNIHSGNNKINWTKTIAKNKVVIQDNTPIYYEPTNKKKQVNYDEELLIIFYSILYHLNEKYNFPVYLNANFDLITGKRFEQYIKGMGKRRLKQIKYKYFSDMDLQIWDLCYAFFNTAYKVSIFCEAKDYLLVHDFHSVFEDMIDELLSDKDKQLEEMKVQEDGKRLDHLYRYQGLIEREEPVYYIGDSKYYNRGHRISEDSIAKQYTYARNLVQYDMDLFNKVKKDKNKKAIVYRDKVTEGYDIVPNFFISAKIDDISPKEYTDSKIVHIPTSDGSQFHVSYHFKNRLFDRDTILVAHYNVKFLFVLALYAKNRSAEQRHWASQVKAQFRKEIIDGLNNEFQFFTLTLKSHDGNLNMDSTVERYFKKLIGKIYKPNENKDMLILALDKQYSFDELEAQIKGDFEIEPYKLGET